MKREDVEIQRLRRTIWNLEADRAHALRMGLVIGFVMGGGWFVVLWKLVL